MRTTAAVAHGLQTPFVVEDVELPDLQDTDVLVRIAAVGVCHTDMASRDGQLPAAVLGAVVSGCGRIIAVDRNDNKLELAKRLGATDTINTKQVPDLGSSIRSVVPHGVNFLVDAAGVDALIGTALTSLAKRGTLGLVAVPPSAEKKLALPWASVLLQGQTVRGFMEGNSIPDIFIPQLIELDAQGRFPFDKFVRFYPFAEINRAVEDQRNGIAIKRSSKWLPQDLER